MSRRAHNLTALLLSAAGLTFVPHAAAQTRACLRAHEQAQDFRHEGQLLAAREQLLLCGQPSCPDLVIADCAQWLAEVEAGLPSVVFAISNPAGEDLDGVRIYANDQPITAPADGRAMLLDPGRYTFRIEAAGYTPALQTVVIHEAEKSRILRIRMQAEPGTTEPTSGEPAFWAGVPVASYVLAGVAVVGLGVFIYGAIAGTQGYDDAERCKPDCDPELLDDAERDYLVADLGLLGALLSTGAATTVYFLARDRPDTSATAQQRLSLGVSAHGAHVQLGARF